jgi:4-hydroxybenzoate polyprenyltransferase
LIAHQVMEYEMDIDSTKTTITGLGQRKGLLLLGAFAVASAMMLLLVAPAVQLPPMAVAAAGLYLLAYPIYSCRGIFNDIRHCASAQ